MIRKGLILAAMVWTLTASLVQAHALEPGYLSLRQMVPNTWQVFFRKPDVQGRPMAITLALPPDCSAPLTDKPVFDGGAWVSNHVTECETPLVGQTLTIEGLEAQRTDVLVRVEYVDGRADTVRLTPDEPGFTLTAAPTPMGVLSGYFALGFEHILEGLDHLLFVFALLLLIPDTWRLIGAITAFTVAHSITLGLAALGYVSLPSPPVEAIIALSILFLAVEVLKNDPSNPRLSERAPWVVSFAFGLLHGLGFAGALTEIGLPVNDIPLALLGFNLGVEAGQITFVLVVLTALFILRRLVAGLPAGAGALARIVPTLTAYTVGGIATFWLVQRISGF